MISVRNKQATSVGNAAGYLLVIVNIWLFAQQITSGIYRNRSAKCLRYLLLLLFVTLQAGCSSDSVSLDENTYLHNAQGAAEIALSKAQAANASGTFGVGGVIVENSSGRVIFALSNHVLETLKPAVQITPGEAYTFDPTAHGERQLVYWYYQNRAALSLPAPNQLTIVTSLDPCAMCTGTLLAAGFNVGVVAIDDWAGINYTTLFNFPGLPEGLKQMIQTRFGYYAVDGIRSYVGGDSVAFRSTGVTKTTHQDSLSIFLSNVDKIRENSQGSGVDPKYLTDPARLPDGSAVKTAFKALFSGAFSHKLTNFRAPDATLKGILTALMNSTSRAKNAVALVDPFGNLIMASADTFDVSPVATGFMNLVQDYSKIRFNLVNNPDTTAEARKSLTHPKYGTFVFLYAPSPNDLLTLKDLGAYGSTMEGAIPQTVPSNFQYYYPPREGTIAELLALIAVMPPFYTKNVGIVPQQVQGL
jgi:cytosine deaminase